MISIIRKIQDFFADNASLGPEVAGTEFYDPPNPALTSVPPEGYPGEVLAVVYGNAVSHISANFDHTRF